MQPRYYPRAVFQRSAVFPVDGRIGEGQMLDLTVPGRLIDSPCSPHEGDSLELWLDRPQLGAMFRLARGVVLWMQGSGFRVEFSEMEQRKRFRYHATLGTLLHEQVVGRRCERAS